MRMITEEEIPCWYQLSWIHMPPQIVLRIHQDRIASRQEIPLEALMKYFLDEFGFTHFQGFFRWKFLVG